MNKRFDGSRDVDRAIDRLARRLPEPLEDLAWISYNYLWSWTPGGPEMFRAIDQHRFMLAGENPVRFLLNLPERDLLRAATNPEILERVAQVSQSMESHMQRPTQRSSAQNSVSTPPYRCIRAGWESSPGIT